MRGIQLVYCFHAENAQTATNGQSFVKIGAVITCSYEITLKTITRPLPITWFGRRVERPRSGST
jgi:hypothetical protein